MSDQGPKIFQSLPGGGGPGGGGGGGQVTVVANALTLVFPAGNTVGWYRARANEASPLASDAVARRGSTEVSNDTILNAGDYLTFSRNTGQKG